MFMGLHSPIFCQNMLLFSYSCLVIPAYIHKHTYKYSMGKSPLTYVLVLALVLGFAVSNQSLVVVTSENKLNAPVLDTQKLQQHCKNNQVSSFLVDSSSFSDSASKVVKEALKKAGIKESNVNSFLVNTETLLEQKLQPLVSQSQQLGITELAEALASNPSSIIYIINNKTMINPPQHRLLQATQQPNSTSLLLLNMTPAVASGLFVAVFLIVVLLIAISCLYDIKTNDKFASNQLFVGKES